jgi:hypothetical protein
MCESAWGELPALLLTALLSALFFLPVLLWLSAALLSRALTALLAALLLSTLLLSTLLLSALLIAILLHAGSPSAESLMREDAHRERNGHAMRARRPNGGKSVRIRRGSL